MGCVCVRVLKSGTEMVTGKRLVKRKRRVPNTRTREMDRSSPAAAFLKGVKSLISCTPCTYDRVVFECYEYLYAFILSVY